jgi:small subunit ribosomal protein S8
MFTDPIGDMIARMRNVQMRGRKEVRMPHSRVKEKILDVLLREGYIDGYSVDDLDVVKKVLCVRLKYGADRRPVIRHIARTSKPSLHVYSSVRDLNKSRSRMGSAVLTTSRGILSDNEARSLGVGGKVLLEVR